MVTRAGDGPVSPELRMEAGRRIAIIIVNYRTPDLTLACVQSLAPSLEAVDARVVIVDNDSQDGSAGKLTASLRGLTDHGRISVLPAAHNGGFSAGNNLGAAALNAEWYFFLNSDALARPGALEALSAAADSNPGAGLIAPGIVNADGALEVSRFRNHSPLSEFVDGARTGPVTKLFPRAEVPIFPDDTNARAGWVSFAAVLVSAAAIRAAGPMDEDFFLYYEDCDYCRRITASGFKIAYAPDAVFQHDQGGSTQLGAKSGRAERLPAYYYASRSRYFRKYYGPAGPLRANLAWYAGRSIALLRGAIGKPAPAVCKGRARDIWIGWRGK